MSSLEGFQFGAATRLEIRQHNDHFALPTNDFEVTWGFWIEQTIYDSNKSLRYTFFMFPEPIIVCGCIMRFHNISSPKNCFVPSPVLLVLRKEASKL